MRIIAQFCAWKTYYNQYSRIQSDSVQFIYYAVNNESMWGLYL